MAKKKFQVRGIVAFTIAGLVVVLVIFEVSGISLVSGLENIAPTIDDTPLEVPFGDLPPEEIEELPIDDSFNCIVENSLVEPCQGEPIKVTFEPAIKFPPIITSNDTETEQYEEEINSEPVTIAIKSITKLIDAQGNVTESVTNSDIPLFAFFVEDISNVDFSNGIIETELQIITSRQTEINGNATITIFISNQTIGEPIRLDVDLITDENGIANIDFLSPTGIGSKQLTFQFNDHIDKFPVSGLTKIQYVLDLELETNQNRFVQEDFVIYSVDIATDVNQIIILNEEGGLVRVYPTDDNFTVRNSGQYTRWIGCGSSTGGRCTSTYIRCNQSSIGTAGTLEIFDLDNNKVFEHLLRTRTGNTNWSSGTPCSGSGDSVLLQRNAEYTVQFTSVKAGLPSTTWTLQTPESQKNYSYTCSWSFTLPVSCNFPQSGAIVG